MRTSRILSSRGRLRRRIGAPLANAAVLLVTTLLVRAIAQAAAPPPVAPLAAGPVDAPIDLRGRVVDPAGRPLAGAAIEILDFAEPGAHARTFSASDGRFTFRALARRSVLLRVSHDSHYTELVPVDLQRPHRRRTVDTGAIALTARGPGRARLMFVGDTMFGRRFVDGDGDGIEGEPDDLIRPKSRAQDAARVLAFVRDVLLTADYAHANLECVVTGDPATPHPYKPYTLYTHPDALRALTDAGFDGVSLGNNHVFDFLARGVADTLQFVGAAGLDHSGAGMNESQALRSTIHATPGGIELALLGLSDMRYDGGVDRSEYLLVAADPAKPGALHASIANLTAFLTAEAGAFAIPVLHGGAEYTHHPSDAMRELFIAAIRAGAGLVIAHHPHVLHGIGLVDGDRGPRFAVMSLGNFVFDQDMAETIESAIAVVDVERLPDGSHDVARVVLIPVVLDHYVPKLLAGEGLVRLGRKLGHLSTTLPTHAGDPPKQVDGLRGAVVFVSGARIVALRDFAQYRQIEQDEALNLPVRGRATAPLPYPRRLPADFLARVRTDVPATLELGRDVLGVGDFEDHDVDGEVGENPGWVLGSSAFLQSRTVHGGVRAAALRRHRGERAFAPLQTARRVPITGGARVTIRGYVRGHDAGRLTIRARFASDTEVLAERTLTLAARGTYGWTPFSLSAIAPKQARGLHLSFRQGRPDGEAGTIYLDDIAVVQWEREIAHSESGPQLATPNDWSFFRFTDLPFGVDRITATLTHRAYLLR